MPWFRLAAVLDLVRPWISKRFDSDSGRRPGVGSTGEDQLTRAALLVVGLPPAGPASILAVENNFIANSIFNSESCPTPYLGGTAVGNSNG